MIDAEYAAPTPVAQPTAGQPSRAIRPPPISSRVLIEGSSWHLSRSKSQYSCQLYSIHQYNLYL